MPGGGKVSGDAEREARARFVEQFAMLLSDAGMQRMPARVFAYVLASDAETHTAAELADGLRVSAAAISGAVRPLVDMGILVRDRAPGDRVDHYRVYGDDVWSTLIGRQEPMYRHIDVLFTEGLKTLSPGAGRRRIHETREFYRFVHAEFDTLTRRWRERRAGVSESPEPARAAPGE
ncbi:GbsR/MarR family transcriptional regulator [Jiangella rhizosphaerae]|uniref:MarR family transcriptional regulator n=1 Tax=Jiangella rhizosphaerae TaxID=2293569 RepID=A0A418KPQ8_9ACTN|nr:MarR family transcriptional regulator [Jiangella rhizosphaerae]RIQ21102.1 MarR family transcriptional regulator [Jiangella rhizosphaerae]